MRFHVGYHREHGRTVQVDLNDHIGDDVLILCKSTGQVLVNHETTAVSQVWELYGDGGVAFGAIAKLKGIHFIPRGGFDQNDVGDFDDLVVVFSRVLGVGIGIYMLLRVGICAISQQNTYEEKPMFHVEPTLLQQMLCQMLVDENVFFIVLCIA